MQNWFNILKQGFGRFMIDKARAPPLVLFLQLGYLTLFGVLSHSKIILIAAILFTLVQKKNYFWYVGVIIQPGLGYYGIINFVFGLLSCNERWRILLLTYILVFFMTFTNQKLHYAINIIVLIALSMQTYSKFPFATLKQNRNYFIGFVCLLTYFSFNFFLSISYITWDKTIYSSIFLMIVISILGYQLMIRKIWTLSNTIFQEIQTPNKVLHYLDNIKQKGTSHLEKIGIENIHRLNCKQPDCFCKTKFQVPFQRLYIRKLTKISLKNFSSFEFRQTLQQYYIDQLLIDGMFPLAVEMFLKQNNYEWDIFKEVRIRRLRDSLERRLAHIESSYCWKTVFKDPFEYEKNFEELRRFILQLISLKIEFWNQILKKIVVAKKLKELGYYFLEKFNKMNRFYESKIVPIQKQIRIFSGAILYNLFLLISTNYKQMAQTNIKALRKGNESRQEQKKPYKVGIIKASLTKQRMGIIQNLNNNCVRMLGDNYSKLDYLGTSVDNLVPQPYLQQHCAGMRNLRQFNSQKLIGSELDTTFILNNNNNLVACSIFYRFSPNIFNELSIITMLKHFKDDNQYILINGEGNSQYTSDDKVDIGIVQTKEIQKIINQFKREWERVNNNNPYYSLPEAIKIQIKFKESDYICIVQNSPLCQSFKYPKVPPIHLSIKNETKTYFGDDDLGEEADVGALKKIQVVLDQNETESQASSMSRRSSIIQVLKMFESNSGVHLFKYFYVALSIIIIFLVLFIAIQYVFTQINWLKQSTSEKNIIRLFVTHYEIHYWLVGFVNKGMSLYGLKKGTITNDDYSQSYGTSNYSQSVLLQIQSMCISLSSLVYQKDVLRPAGGSGYQAKLYENLHVQFKSGEKITMMFSNIINLAIGNCYQMSHGVNFWQVATFEYYWSLILPNYYDLLQILRSQIQNDLNYYLKLSFTLLVLFTILTIVSLIPIYFGNKKLGRQQDYIFDLMTSISVNLIEEDIINLADLQISLKSNYSGTFNFDEKQNSHFKNQRNVEPDEKNSIKTGGFDNKRKRAGELDTKGNNTNKIFLYVIILLSIVFLISIFTLRYQYMKTLQYNFKNMANLKHWRNLNIGQLVNIKKLIYQLRPDQKIIGQQLETRIQAIFEDQRINYPFGDSIQQVPIKCNQSTMTICKNGTISQLSVNIFLFQLMIETFVSRNPQHLGIIAILKDISKNFNDAKVDGFFRNTLAKSKYTQDNVDFVVILALVYLVISVLLIYLYLKKLRKQHMYLSRFITFLSEDMIQKNKRVESYLQRLMKSE